MKASPAPVALAILAGKDVYKRQIWLSVFATLICLLLGYPVAYFIAGCKPSTQRFLQMLIMLPMCMSCLLYTSDVYKRQPPAITTPAGA